MICLSNFAVRLRHVLQRIGYCRGGDYLHNSPSEAQKFNVVQLLISGTSAPTFGNTLLAAGVLKLSK